MPRKQKQQPGGRKPPLTVPQILAWCDDHRKHFGKWPKPTAGKVRIASETWSAIEKALKRGFRGLPGGYSLAKLLADWRGARHPRRLPRLTKKQIVLWAQAFHRRTRKWPRLESGEIPKSGGETWATVAGALMRGKRGLRGGLSLTQFLEQEVGAPNQANRPRLTNKLILAWADAHYAATGRWPNRSSGKIRKNPSENWPKINAALVAGLRGLPGGISLTQLLARERGKRNVGQLGMLKYSRILSWARQYLRAHGRRPTPDSGPVTDAGRETGESWSGIHAALRHGRRGLRANDSLSRLFQRNRLAKKYRSPSAAAKKSHRRRRRAR